MRIDRISERGLEVSRALPTSRAAPLRSTLRSAHRIYVGQRLTIAGASHRSHTVRSGESLTVIARRYGTTVQAIRSANRIRGSVIHPRQVLIIP